MNEQSKYLGIITLITVLFFTGLLGFWQFNIPKTEVVLLNPGEDNRPANLNRSAGEVRIGEFFMRYELYDSPLTEKWCGFRGEDCSNIANRGEILTVSDRDFDINWSVKTGEGHAAPVVYKGLVYFLDYDENISSDMLRCFSLETGKELWRRWYRVPMKRNHGYSRTIPAVGEDYIVTIGPQGHVMCCDPKSGDLKWHIDLVKRFSTDIPFWYTGQCPLVDEKTLVLAPAGKDTLMLGMDITNGRVKWGTANTLNLKMSHSSIIPMRIEGEKTYVYMGVGGVCGVSAEAKTEGKLLWSSVKWQPSVVAPSALQISNNSILLVAGYGAGGAIIRIDGGNVILEKQYKPNEGLASEQQTPIVLNDRIYTVLPKDGGNLRGRLVVYSVRDLQKPVWTSSSEERFGLGPYLMVGDKFFVLKDDGELFVYQVYKDNLKLLKQQRVLDGVDAWGPMAYADGRLILRDAHNVICLKIK